MTKCPCSAGKLWFISHCLNKIAQDVLKIIFRMKTGMHLKLQIFPFLSEIVKIVVSLLKWASTFGIGFIYTISFRHYRINRIAWLPGRGSFLLNVTGSFGLRKRFWPCINLNTSLNAFHSIKNNCTNILLDCCLLHAVTQWKIL